MKLEKHLLTFCIVGWIIFLLITLYNTSTRDKELISINHQNNVLEQRN